MGCLYSISSFNASDINLKDIKYAPNISYKDNYENTYKLKEEVLQMI